jgi:hypothetical protein
MSQGKWSGGVANRYWARPGSRREFTPADAELGHRLYEQLAGEGFYCQNCGRLHPLREHRICRAEFPYRLDWKADR